MLRHVVSAPSKGLTSVRCNSFETGICCPAVAIAAPMSLQEARAGAFGEVVALDGFVLLRRQ